MNAHKNEFIKNGVINIKNFFSANENSIIENRTLELVQKKINFLYTINKEKINNSFLIKKKYIDLKNNIIAKCENKNIEIKSLNDFIDFISPIIKDSKTKDDLIIRLHEIFLDKHPLIIDFLHDEVFSSVFLSNKILDIYKELLETEELIYSGESSISYNKHAYTGWHSDDQKNYSLSKNEKTFQIRGGFFFQSTEGNSGGIKFLRGSHFYMSPLKLFKKIIKKLIKNENFDNSIANLRILRSKNFFPNKKDFCLWDKRIIHSPWAIKLKKLPNVSLHPKVENFFLKKENLLPIFEKRSFPRSLGSLDFARKSDGYNAYIENLNNRSDYNNYWLSKKYIITDDFISKLKKKKIILNTKCFEKHIQ